MRKRHKPRVTWFPVLGQGSGEAVFPGDSSWGREVAVDIPVDGGPNLFVTPVIWDAPQEPDDVASGDTTPLVDFVGNEYLLKRIVGHCFVSYALGLESNGSNFGAVVTAGFFVARAQDSKISPPGVDAPLGYSGVQADDNLNFSPDNVSTVREPWIWRRKWIISNENNVGQSNRSIGFPAGNFAYGSMADGPRIDSKISRRIGNDDRLWFAIVARTWPTFNTYTFNDSGGADFIEVTLDARVLGTLRKARNRSTF